MAPLSLLLQMEVANFNLVLYFFADNACPLFTPPHQSRVGTGRKLTQTKQRASKKISARREKTGMLMSLSEGQATSLVLFFKVPLQKKHFSLLKQAHIVPRGVLLVQYYWRFGGHKRPFFHCKINWNKAERNVPSETWKVKEIPTERVNFSVQCMKFPLHCCEMRCANLCPTFQKYL